MLIVSLYLIAFLIIFGTFMNILQIGEPREPITPGMAVAILVVNTLIVSAVLVAALELS